MTARSAARRGAQSFGLYGASVALSGVVSLTAIPVIIAIVGADTWASMATGQSIGGWTAVMVAFGWGLTGPATVARTEAAHRPQLFLNSLFARGALLVPLLIVQTAITLAVVPQAEVVALVAGVAMTLAGVSANWYFTGESRPGRFLLLDTAPRVAGTVVGLALVAGTHELLYFALAQLAGAVAALVASTAVVLRGSRLSLGQAARWAHIRARLGEQRHGVLATGLYAAFTPAVLGIIAVASPALLPVFVLADRISRFIGMAVSPLNLVFQGWVPAATGAELARRVRFSGGIIGLTALAVGALFSLLFPQVGLTLTSGQVIVAPLTAVAFGLIAAGQIVLPYLTNVGLMAVGRLRVISLTASVGVPLAIGGLLITQAAQLATLAVWSLVAGNLVIIGWQFLVLRRVLREPRFAPATRPVEPAVAG